ncbi:hypothetical protein J2S71_000829 [Olsenella profusa DSM 13989]|uniref:hypothetical protein n=1 Tax=Olsenella profusa TaxID=138595 RepID=UPI0027852EA7|nr:hypothetical protein [Olsenella profusa]MDP9859133.1 hypothetical protein [Olsenella profusa DSM 13989]
MGTSRGRMGRAAAACLVAAACAAGTTACSSPEQGNPAEQPTRVADLRPDLSSDEVTDRDLAMAEQLGAPDDIISSLKEGTWPSSISRKNVRYAEAAEDYLRLRYGTSFAAYDCFISTWIIQDYNVINLRATEGEHEGESCRVEIWDADDPRWRDDWLPRIVGPEWESMVAAAAQPVLEGLPEGTWTSSVHISTATTVSSRVEGTTVAEVGNGVYGSISVSVVESCPLSDEQLEQLLNDLTSVEEETGLNVGIYVDRVVNPPEGQAFDEAYVSGLSGEGGFLWSRHKEVNKNEHPYP